MEDKGVQEIKNAPNKGPEYVLKYIHFPQCVSIRANLCLLVLYILFTLHIPFLSLSYTVIKGNIIFGSALARETGGLNPVTWNSLEKRHCRNTGFYYHYYYSVELEILPSTPL